MEPIKPPEIKLHNGLAVPQRVVTKVSGFAAQGLTPNWLSSLPMVIAEICAKWQIELESVATDTYMTLVLFGRSPSLGPVVIKSTPISGDFVAQARAFEIAANIADDRIDLGDGEAKAVGDRRGHGAV